MSAKPFLDTNVFVYAFTKEDPRQEKALSLLAGGGLISVQVLNEFVNVAYRKMRYEWPEIERQRSVLFELLHTPIPLTLAIHELAVALMRRHKLSIYDALIIAAALQAGCSTIYSEDMQDGQAIQGITISNPFV